MPRDLQSLLVAGGALGVSGEDFLSDVPGAAAGVEMDDYEITGASFSGNPLDDIVGGYSSNHLFSIVASISRNSKASLIQRNLTTAWSFSVTGGSGASATKESFVSGGGGATHTIGVRVRGATGGTPNVTGSTSQPDFATDSDPHYVRFSAVGSSSGAGQSALTLHATYSPDLGGFNPQIAASWPFTMDDRALTTSDFQFQWRTASGGGGTLVSSSAAFDLTNSALYPSVPEGLLPGESITLYLRWRVGSSGSYTEEGPITCNDPRPPE